jgi:hypothetical protein
MYVKITNGVVGLYSIYELEREYPTTSFPANLTAETLVGYDVYPCTQATMPPYDGMTQNCDPGEFISGVGGYSRVWAVTNKPAEDAARNIRSHRNVLLAETDWMALSDNTATLEWATYRQYLRDVTSQTDFPYNVNWPVKPESTT